MQIELPDSLENFPTGHAIMVLAPVLFTKKPGVASRQPFKLPVVFEKLPVAQRVATDKPIESQVAPVDHVCMIICDQEE